MRIVTYAFLDTDPPAGCEAIARILIPGKDAKGRPAEVWHPVIIHGRTVGDAHLKAEAWWNAELSKEHARQETVERLSEARRKKATA